MLNSYTYQITDYFGFQTPWYVEYMICFGQVVWQGVMITLWSRKNSWDYLGNMSAVSTLGGILLLPILLLQQFIELHPFLYIGYFMLVVGVMLLEHIRRCGNMKLGYLPTVSWLSFRCVVLIIILTLFN